MMHSSPSIVWTEYVPWRKEYRWYLLCLAAGTVFGILPFFYLKFLHTQFMTSMDAFALSSPEVRLWFTLMIGASILSPVLLTLSASGTTPSIGTITSVAFRDLLDESLFTNALHSSFSTFQNRLSVAQMTAYDLVSQFNYTLVRLASTCTALAIMFVYHPITILFQVVPMILLLVCLVPLNVRIVRRFECIKQELMVACTQRFRESLGHLKAVKLYNQSHKERTFMEVRCERYTREIGALSHSRLYFWTSALYDAGSTTLVYGVVPVAFVWYVIRNPTSFDSFHSWILTAYAPFLAMQVFQLGYHWTRLVTALSILHSVLPAEQPQRIPLHEPISSAELLLSGVSLTLQDKPVLHNIDLAIPARGIVAIVGRSGSGKTKLLDVLCGFHSSDLSGKVSGSLHPLLFAPSLGDTLLLYGSTVRENVLYCHSTPSWVSDDTVNTHLASLGLSLRAQDLLPKTLSNGEKQRIAWARLFLSDSTAPTLVMDESLSSLDAQVQRMLWNDLLPRFQRIVFADHQLANVQRSDWVVYLEEGQVREFGSTTFLLSSESYSQTRRLF